MRMSVNRTPISTVDPFEIEKVKLHLRVDHSEDDTAIRNMAELTSSVQSCISLWEGGFAMADVKGTDLLTR